MKFELKVSPSLILELRDNEIFVFGSNLMGVHGAGAAFLAFQKFGAKRGKGRGRTGRCYAIPTKDEAIQTLSIRRIAIYVRAFLRYAHRHQELDFLVTEVGCGLAGYQPESIAPLFKEVQVLEMANVYLPLRFVEILTNKKI